MRARDEEGRVVARPRKRKQQPQGTAVRRWRQAATLRRIGQGRHERLQAAAAAFAAFAPLMPRVMP